MIKSTTTGATKRQKHHHNKHHQDPHHQMCEDDESLLPGLPDHISQLCLSLVPPSILFSVCKSWRRLIYAPSFPPYLSLYALLLSSQSSKNQSHLSDSLNFSSFDPISSNWQSIPQPPHDPHHHLLFHHPSFISRRLPIQSVTVSGNLVLLAATTDRFLPALTRPLVFNPDDRTWSHGPPFDVPRRWCAAGTVNGIIYVASGIGSHYNPDVARSIEKWDLKNNNHKRSWKWEKRGSLRDGKFSREAIDAVGWRGKLCMVNVKGGTSKQGIIYDVNNDSWEEMPDGMLAGWRGPAAAMDEETIFMVDECKGILKRYDPEMDLWAEIFEDKVLKVAQYVAAGGGRVCIVCGSGMSILVVDVRTAPPHVRVVETPPETQAIAVHILPRMSH